MRLVGGSLSLLAFLVLGVGLGKPALAASLIFSDFDDTLVETREEMGGTFSTRYVLFRIPFRPTTSLEIPPGPEKIEVSPSLFRRMSRHLAWGIDQPGNINREVTLADGTKVRAGHYLVKNPESFAYFLDYPEAPNNLLLDFKTAELSGGDLWKGPYWKYMQLILSRPDTAATFRIITARGHSDNQWSQLFQYWQHRKYIDFEPNYSLFHNASLPKYDRYTLSHNISERKTKIMERILLTLGTTATSAGDYRLSPNGKGFETRHFVIFVDNDQDTLAAIIEMFQETMRKRKVPVKLGVFNAGNSTQVAESGRPQFAIMREDGTFRPATEQEIVGEPGIPLSFPNGLKSCAAGIAEGAE